MRSDGATDFCTYKVYTLRCHPQLRALLGTGAGSRLGDTQTMTCQNAIASLAGLTGEPYEALDVET